MSLEFSATTKLGDFQFEAAFEVRNEIVVLFGHSGAGKSLTLQMTAGLITPERGRIAIGGEIVFDADRGINLSPQRRTTGYVVQDLALFPHMTVAQNVAFGIAGRKVETTRQVTELMTTLGLEGYADRLPRSLSGGQQQRVALARALGRGANLLLLDEPFSALDESLRTNLRRELLRLRADMGLSIVFVTHDLREAHLLADRIAVFDEGRLLQFESRDTVFRHPASRRVAELTGVANILGGIVVAEGAGHVRVRAGPLELVCAQARPQFVPGRAVDVAFRAERVVLRRGVAAETPGENVFAAEIVEEFAYGSGHTLRMRLVGTEILLEAELAARPYEVLGGAARRLWTVELPPADLHVMPA